MPAKPDLSLHAGQIVLADWHGDPLLKEPNKRRPAVVVEDDGLFDRADHGELLQQTVLGRVTPRGDDSEGTPAGYVLSGHARSVGSHSPADCACCRC